MRRRKLQAGFTLAEMLVILAIMAALAAILLPVVTSQVAKSQAAEVVGDLTSLRTAAETFVVNVGRYPGDIDDLTAPITDATDLDINGDAYPAGLQGKWSGPYLDKVIGDDGALATGFGGRIQDALQTKAHPSAATVNYLTVQILGIAQADFNRIDEQIDGGDGNAAGRLLWTTHADPDSTSTQYLMLPVN
jgi:type II secretory pathway pseudopilin PulG